MTRYQCKGCQIIFEGFDPVKLGDAILIFPLCPRAQLLTVNSKQGLEATAVQLDEIERKHPVSLAVIVAEDKGTALPTAVDSAPKVQPKATLGSWGKPLTVKAETPEESRRAEQQRAIDKLLQKRKEEDEQAEGEARRLVQRMHRVINGGDGSKSSDFPMDLQYGTKDSGNQETAPVDIIVRAGVIWLAQGRDYSYRPPKWKKKWKQEMANFEKLIVPGQPDRGKHNYHVVPK